jgi:Phosphate-selective porin O and P
MATNVILLSYTLRNLPDAVPSIRRRRIHNKGSGTAFVSPRVCASYGPAPVKLASCAAATSVHAVDIGDNTTVGGVAFMDFSNISNDTQQTDKSYKATATQNGTGFDVKRFYLVVDHKFDDVWSADLTTDAQYASAGSTFNTNGSNGSGGVTEVMIKKLYLQGKFSDALTVHIGSYDMPWIPFEESLYGYRFIEKLPADRLGFGNTTDWGINASGNFAGNTVTYSTSLVNGTGYKNPTRSKDVDFEGRLSVKPLDWLTLAIGGYTGHIGQVTSVNSNLDNNAVARYDALIAVKTHGFTAIVEFMDAKNYKTVNTSGSLGGSGAPSTIIGSSPTLAPEPDQAAGIMGFLSYTINPELSVFTRYDQFKLSEDSWDNGLKDQYYNFGIDYKPYKAVDVALVYKNEKVSNGATSLSSGDANSSFTVGGVNSTTNGRYSEFGVYLQYKF